MHSRRNSSQTISESLLYQIYLETENQNLDLMPEQKINEIFELTMDVLSSKDRNKMMEMSLDKKKILITQVLENRNVYGFAGKSSSNKQPKFYVDMINQLVSASGKMNVVREILISIRDLVQLTNRQRKGRAFYRFGFKEICKSKKSSWIEGFSLGVKNSMSDAVR